MDKSSIYDLIIIGGGSAGLSAGIYAGRARLRTLILEKSNPGGQTANTAEVVNYPGIRKTGGPELMHEMHLHAKDFGVEVKTANIESVDFTGEVKTLHAPEGDFHARAVIIATGANPRKIGFEGEDKYAGRGVAYCATCDGEFFSGLDIFVVGGGFAAAEEAVYLTRFAKSVTIIVREDDFTCARSVADKAIRHPNITVHYATELARLEGDDLPRRAVFRDRDSGKETFAYDVPEGKTFGVFVFAGYLPATDVFRGHIVLDEQGYIPTDDMLRTNVPGVFAAGDLRPKSLRQIVTAVSDGAIAATSAEKYIAVERERLGLPAVGEDLPEPAAPATPEPQKPAAPADGGTDGAFLTADLQAQMRGVFERFTKDVHLAVYLDGENASRDMRAFLEETAALSDRISLDFRTFGKDDAEQARLGVERAPCAVLLDDGGNSTGVLFSGTPGGHETTSFVLGLYHYAAKDGLTDAQRAAIAAITKPVKLQVCVMLSCHFCPEVVMGAHSIALANPNVTAEMVDIGLYPDLRSKFNIMSVPVLLVDGGDSVVFGAKTLDELIDITAKA